MSQFYTPERANKSLPEIRTVVSKIVELKRGIDSLQGKEGKERIEEISFLISKLEAKGIELKDMDLGLIDFPAQRFSETVYLCWKLGEPEVLYWHEVQGGFRGRKPLKPESLKAE